ncbi:MAG TPA: magnesium transporter [Chloroflexi bacterium]|nr:magnesium transporter [Chloroflexota bacterium]
MATHKRKPLPIASAGRLVRPGNSRARKADATGGASRLQVVVHDGLRWIDIRKPGPQEIEYLRNEFGFHELLLDDVISRTQRPKIDIDDDYAFLVMHFPVHNKETRVTTASEVDFFVGRDYVITAHDGVLRPLGGMFDQAAKSEDAREAMMSQSPLHLLYYVIDRLVDYCFPIVNRLSERIETIEDAIFNSSGLRTVQEISVVRRDLIALRRIMKPQLAIISQLEHRGLPVVRSDIEADVYFGDVADHLAKIWDSLDDLKEVLNGLSDTFDSLASHRLNEVIKALTVISVIILPLTLITSIFGMNVPLPYEHSPYALVIISALMLAIIVGMILVFRMRRWI